MSINSRIEGEVQPRGEPELIVITRSEAKVRVEDDQVASLTGEPVADIQDVLEAGGARIEPLFGAEAGETAEFAPSADVPEAGFGTFFRVHAPEDRLEALAEQLRGLEIVDGAYVKPPAEPASITLERPGVMLIPEPVVEEAPTTTPDFTPRQDYRDPAPVGIDVPYAWTLPGGRGQNVKVIDCEWGWRFTHEDLVQNQLGLVGGSNHTSTNHGTAVFGEIGGDENAFGVTGIAPASPLGASSFVGQSTPAAIKKAADSLAAGDIILLEIHRPGPNSGGGGQQGYIAIEWWPDDFLAIRYAVNKGIIVVEAAGNGWENLDAAVYNVPQTGFPSWWKNPFNLANPSSGAVVAGAGDPPSGTHGRTISPWNQPYVDRARSGFSNWGSRLDAQGWGWEVTSAGYGDLQGGSDANRWYTDVFSGTSSASPIVLGTLACTQGVLKAKGMPLMSSERARQLLRATGSPQQSAPDRPASQRIGNRPNLRQLIPAALRQWIYSTTIQYTYALTASQSAWAYITGLGWRQLATGSPDGVANVHAIACEAQASGKPVHVYIDDTKLYNIWIP
jgi:Subtilase family